MDVALITDTISEAWAGFVRQHPAAAWYHDPGWGAVMRASYGLRSMTAEIRHNGQLAGGVLLVGCPRIPIGWRLIAGPFLASGGLLLGGGVDRGDAERALLAAVRKAGYGTVELREREPASVPGSGDLVTMVLALPDMAEALWIDLDPKVRNQVRKGQKSGLSVVRGREHAQAFWEIYARHQLAHGTPTHGAAFFRAIVDIFPENSEVLLVRKGDAIVGGMIAYHGHGAFVALNACSLRDYNALCVNHFLYWEALTLAIACGAKAFDFGRSVFGSGTFDFKKQWGAAPVRLRYVDLGRGPVAAPTESDGLKTAANVWAKLPAGLANRLGPRVRPYLA